MSGPPLRKLLSFWASQAAGSFVSGLALAPGPGPGSASSSLRGALPWRPDHPTVARGSSQQANWRWFRPPRLAHRAQTPGRPVRAKLDHATLRVRPDSTRFDACRAAPLCAPTSLDMDNPLRVAPCSCSKLALNSCAVSGGSLALSMAFIASIVRAGSWRLLVMISGRSPSSPSSPSSLPLGRNGSQNWSTSSGPIDNNASSVPNCPSRHFVRPQWKMGYSPGRL